MLNFTQLALIAGLLTAILLGAGGEHRTANYDSSGTQMKDTAEAQTSEYLEKWISREHPVLVIFNTISDREYEFCVSLQHSVDIAVLLAKTASEFEGKYVSPDEFELTLHTFNWLDFITPEQLNIVIDFLGIPTGSFDDNMVYFYAWDVMRPTSELEYYANIPLEDMPNNPKRIIAAMYEALLVVYTEQAQDRPLYFSEELGRFPKDWRNQDGN